MSSVHGAELVHFHIDYALHVASLKCIPGYLLGECRKLNRLIEYHEVFLRLQLSLAIVNLMIPFVLPYEAVVLLSSEMTSRHHGSLLNAVLTCSKNPRGHRFRCGMLLLGIVHEEVLRILVQECVIQVNHLQLLDVISGGDLLRIMPLMSNTGLDSRNHRLFWRRFSQFVGSRLAYRLDVPLVILLSVSLNVYAVEHTHLCCQLLREIYVILLLLAEIVDLNGSKALVEIFEQLPVLLPCKESGDQRFLLLLELDEFLELLLLKLVADQFDVLAEVADLRDLLLLGVCKLMIDGVDILLHLFLGLQQRLAVLLLFCDIVDGQVTWVRLRVQVALVEALPSIGLYHTGLQWGCLTELLTTFDTAKEIFLAAH